MTVSVLRKKDDLFVQWNIPKNEIGELQDYEEPCDYINITKLIKRNFSRNFYRKKSTFYEFSPLNFQKKITKCIWFQSAANYLYIRRIFIHELIIIEW